MADLVTSPQLIENGNFWQLYMHQHLLVSTPNPQREEAQIEEGMVSVSGNITDGWSTSKQSGYEAEYYATPVQVFP